MAQGPSVALCDYVNIKSFKITEDKESKEASSPGTNRKIFKHWTNLWVVLHTETSPAYCFIGHCKKEGDWLINNKIDKVFLGETFTLERMPTGYSKKFENVMQITFNSYKLDLGFDSMTKMDQWYLALQRIADCHHVDLVRCPEHSKLEGEYVVQVCSTSYKVWTLDSKAESKVKWEWALKHIRRVHWHKNLHKLEVEPGRSSSTGEGHFYFTGEHASRLFYTMRHMMTTHSKLTSPTPSNTSSPITSPTPSARRGIDESIHVTSQMYGRFDRVGDSEDDWTGGTGTGDDWTGTSDSGFAIGPRANGVLAGGLLPNGPAPPLPPRGPQSENTKLYTDINVYAMDPDNQYVQINRSNGSSHVYDMVPMDRATPPPSQTHYQVPRPVPTSNSQNCLATLSDEYCTMLPGRAIIRNGSLPMERPPPVPPHKKNSVPALAWNESRFSEH